MKDPYTFSTKVTIALSIIYLRRVSLHLLQKLPKFGLWTTQSENFSNTIMTDIFPTRLLNYNLKSQINFFRKSVKTTKFG